MITKSDYISKTMNRTKKIIYSKNERQINFRFPNKIPPIKSPRPKSPRKKKLASFFCSYVVLVSSSLRSREDSSRNRLAQSGIQRDFFGGIFAGGIFSGGISSGGIFSGGIFSGGIFSGGILSGYPIPIYPANLVTFEEN